MLIEDSHLLPLPHSSTPLNSIVAWRDGQPITNQEFQTRISLWKILLERTPGSQFALYLRDSFEFASALFGAWLAGKTIVLPNNILPHTCERLINTVDGYLGEFPSQYSPLIPNISKENTDQLFSKIKLHPDLFIKNYMGLVIYTSGSTGEPQAVQKTLSQLFTEVSTLENLFGDTIGSNKTEILSTVSHEHIYGLLFKILWPLLTGRIIHTQSAMFLEELVPIISSRDCILISSPAHLKRFPKSAILNLTKSSQQLRAIFSSASVLSLDVAHNTKHLFGKTPIEIYGSTETGGIAWRQRDEQSDESWQPLPGVSWRISTKESYNINIKNNLLEISSPHLSDNNWFCTADLATVSTANNKHFLLHGRADQIIKLEGKRISLNMIEQHLLQSSLISEARVLMLESNNRQRIAAFIVLSQSGKDILIKSDKMALNKHLRDFLIDSVEPIALPRIWRYLNDLPVNALGKTTNTELMALLDTPIAKQRPLLPHSRLLEQNINQAKFELTIPPDLLYFDGHFPETPILPGVVQIHWAIAYGRHYFHLPLYFRHIQKLKFQSVIQPNMIVMLELLYDPAKYLLTFRLYSQSGQHASGSILFDDKL